ncbi:MAG: sugar transferase, partial [Thermoguttaceae bacterium]|nr:sugar transferase [Thermoguttaceae bacterium]
LVCLLVPQLILDVIWTWIGDKLFFKIYPQKKTLLIYSSPRDKRRFGTIAGKPLERLYKITKELEFNGTYSEIKDQLADYGAVFVAGINSDCRNEILKYCKETGLPGFFLPHIGDAIMQGAKHIPSFDSPVLYVERKVLNAEYSFAKRTFDIVSSAFGLILMSPVLLVTALCIKLYDGGPIFYRQVRLTKNGREFKILKFRSMRVDAEKDGVARLSSGENDDRITPVGHWIRKCRLDEFPQLWNILIGDMGVVGPRPERPEIAEQYYETMPEFKLRLQVKAGLTGYAQVYGKYNTDPYEKLEFDLMYINSMNILTDIRLCFATFGVLFSSESTEGVDANAVTALDHGDDVADKRNTES